MDDVVPLSGPVVFFTGAGISVSAGLPTYRGTGGIYQDTDLEPPHARDLSPDRLPGLWARFADRLQAAHAIAPTAAHRHIAALESVHPDPVCVVTQNVDGLHGLAGSSTVIELHGTLRKMSCLGAGHRIEHQQAHWVDGMPTCPACGSACRPGVVLFGESLPQQAWQQAEAAIRQARTVVAVGTSAQVFPAALLIDDSRVQGAERIWINPEDEPPGPEWTWLRGEADLQVGRLTTS